MYLTISDLRLIIQHLVTDKWELLMRFTIAVIYGPLLKARLAELEALEARLKKRPLAEALKAADVTYDLFGRAVYHLCRVLSPLPLLPGASQTYP